jgi:OmcA/MtrC family decaheme c-type cytochrome
MIQPRRVLLSACFVALAACSGPAGQDGKPCTVTANDNGTATISCPDGTTVDVTNGSNGTSGTNGVNGTNGSNGVNGTSCTVTANPTAGTRTISCADGTSVTLTDGQNGVDANAVVDFTKLTPFELQQEEFSVSIQSVSSDAKPVVRFTLRTNKGQGVKGLPPSNLGGIALLQLVPGNPADGGNGLSIDTWVSHITNCATCTSTTETANATTLVDNGDGTYVYTFAKDVVNPTAYDGGVAIAGVAFDASAAHRFALRLGVSGNPYRPVDATYDYIPATGVNVDGQNDKVNTSNCLSCHNQWRANSLNLGGATPFHGGQRYDVRYCLVCHNDQRKFSGNNIAGNAVIAEPTINAGVLTPPAGRTNIAVLRGEAIIDLPVFIHKIHAGEYLTLKGTYAGMGTEINEFTFPQDVRNCAKCHSKAAKADNWKTKPSRRACGACHDGVNFDTGAGHTPVNLRQPTDNLCTLCHDATVVATQHLAVAEPDPNNANLKLGGTANTHASYVGNILNPPTGARVFKYDLASVTTTDAGTGVYPVVKFRFTENDAGVLFNTSDGGNNLFENFVGAPSVYCAFAMPQDGIAKPADFNAIMGVYLKNAWNGTATAGTGAGSMTGPDSQGYYTVTLKGGAIPPAASMLTCGLGYSYSLASAMPLTQTDLADYAYDAGYKTGGLSMPAPNVWKVAIGYTGRRGATAITAPAGQIVTTSRCAECHNQLGVSPTYHSGQRNDGATCSFCHTQNRTSSGWTAGSESFIHAIHAAQRRTVPFNWKAVGATEDHPSVTGFFGIEYPGRLNYCESCHSPGMYDFSASWYTANNGANLDTRLMQTVATGRYDAVTPLADGGLPALAISVSPYVVADGGTNYGSGYGYNVATQAVTQAASTTLVISPVTNTCFGCHDSARSRLHMESNGATIYGTRSQAQSNVEQCLICHGPGKTASIKEVHYK